MLNYMYHNRQHYHHYYYCQHQMTGQCDIEQILEIQSLQPLLINIITYFFRVSTKDITYSAESWKCNSRIKDDYNFGYSVFSMTIINLNIKFKR